MKNVINLGKYEAKKEKRWSKHKNPWNEYDSLFLKENAVIASK